MNKHTRDQRHGGMLRQGGEAQQDCHPEQQGQAQRIGEMPAPCHQLPGQERTGGNTDGEGNKEQA